MAVAAAAVVLVVGIAAWLGWLRDPSLAKSDYVGTIDVSTEDAKLYRPVPFEWRVDTSQGSFSGTDTAHVRIDNRGERTILCGWLRTDKGGASIRASSWLTEARLRAGNLRMTALFIAPVDKAPGDGLNAGCLRIDEPVHLATDAPLSLVGAPVRE
jgi:hypothetical protein